MLIFDNDSVTGLIAPITAEELTLEPLLHESGAAHYIAVIYVDDIAVHEGDQVDGSLHHSAASGVFQCPGSRNINFRCSLAYVSGKLWLQGWQ